jgi:hypothetical protein
MIDGRDEQIKNYERSYQSMWDEIARARRERDNALKIVDATRDLIIALEKDFSDGTTKTSFDTSNKFNLLRSLLVSHVP